MKTDHAAGQISRLYVHGRSIWEIVFDKYVEGVPEPCADDPCLK